MNIKLASILLLTSLFFIVSIFTLPRYGINWDTINHLPRGQALLHFFLTGSKDYNNLQPFIPNWQDPQTLKIKTDPIEAQVFRRSLYQGDQATFNFFIDKGRFGHPPLSDILSSAFNVVIFQKLGLVNDIDSYRIYGSLLATVLVGLVFYWGFKLWGWFAGLVSALSLALYPLFWAESHFNTEKDIPETVFWSFLLFFVWKGITSKSWKWILGSGIFFGLGLGTKFNILFSSLIILPYIIFMVLTKSLQFNKKFLRLGLVAVMALILGFIIFFGSWPYLWEDPVARISQVINYYQTIGAQPVINPRYSGPFGINLLPLLWISYTTPPTILLFTFVGVIASVEKIFKKKDGTALFFLLWFLIPIIRVSWPGANIYGGVRQIMEFIPGMALLSGLGAWYLVLNAKRFLKVIHFKEISVQILMVILFIPVLFQLIKYHPFENVYFNFLLGGLKGASDTNFPYWGTTFGSAYREGAIWLNNNVEENARVVYSYDLYPNIPRIFLRRDIQLNNKFRSGELAEGEYAVGLVYQGSSGRTYYDTYLEKFVNPIYEIKVDGVVILKIWKNQKVYQKFDLAQKEITGFSTETKENIIKIKLAKPNKISKVEFTYPEREDCKEPTLTYSEYSLNNSAWTRIPSVTTEETDKSILKNNPQRDKHVIYLSGERVDFIQIHSTNPCLLKYNVVKVWEFSNPNLR